MRLLVIFLCVFVNMQEILVVKFGVAELSYVDELFLFFPYLLAPLVIRKRHEAWVYIILLLPIASLLYSLVANLFAFSDFRFESAIIQSLINFKFFLYFVLLYSANIFFKRKTFFYTKLFGLVISLSLAGYFANLLFPQFFVFSDAVWHQERNRISGFQFKPNDLAILISFATVYLLFCRIRIATKVVSIIFLIALIFLSSSRTALLLSLLAVLIYMLMRVRLSIILPGFLVVLFGLVLFHNVLMQSFLFSETFKNIQEFSSIQESQYIRAIMVYLGLQLALTYFPFGVGAGNFGTVMSRGSPVYDSLGVSGSGFFENFEGVYDSNLASIAGEYGFAGIAIYLTFFIKLLFFMLPGQYLQAVILIIFAALLIAVQPLFSYQVNSINFLLLIFALRELNAARPRVAKLLHEDSARFKHVSI